jgi:uncharacterized membrane protein YqaE (UPF0057 family)
MANKVYPLRLPNPVTPLWSDGADFRAGLCDVAGHPLINVNALPGKNAYNNVLFGWHSTYSENGQDLDSAAGIVTKYLTNVPAGFGLVLQNAWATDVTHNLIMFIGVRISGIVHAIYIPFMDVAWLRAVENSEHVLMAGDCVLFTFYGVTLHDLLYWGASGYFFAVA